MQIDCTEAFIPPYGTDAYKGCAALKGAQPGRPYVDGMAYLHETYGIGKYNRWWNFLILMGFWVAILAGMLLAAKWVDYSPRRYSVNVWKRKDRHLAARMGRSRHLQDGHANAPPAGQTTSEDPEAAQKITSLIRAEDFSWKHISYTVPTKDGPKQLLNDVSGFVRAGQLTALMGSSGAGKTTLIDAITQRKTIGKLSGQIYVGKTPQGSDFKRITAYCEQMDVHNNWTTVREALRFSAVLRQAKDVSLEEKYAFVEKVIGLLELEPIADAMIGEVGGGEGISMEERKRVTIGVELVARPRILFLDEPTSKRDLTPTSENT